MKKIKCLLLIFVISLLGVKSVMAASNPFPHYEDSPFGGKIVNCTWYAWEETKKRTGIELPTWYNVWTWHNQAKKSGFQTGKEPRANSLMIWNYGEGFGGHVAYVTSVNGNVITYDEGGSMMSESGIATNQTITLDEIKVVTTDYGFIYLDVPPTTTTAKPTTTKTITTRTTTKTTTSVKTTTVETTTTTTEKTTTTQPTTEASSIVEEKKEELVIVKKKNEKLIIFIIASIIILIVIVSILLLVKNKSKK